MDIMIKFLNSLVFLTAEMAPYLLLGFLIAGALKVFVPQKVFSKKLGKPNLKSVLYGALLGVPLPLCSCGVIPTGISIRNSGASDGATVSFLISTPQTGMDSILITWSMLGWPFALLRPVIAFLTGIFGGSLVNFFEKKSSKKSPERTMQIFGNQEGTFFDKIKAMLRYSFVDFLDDIVKWLSIGLILAALLDVLLPDTFITNHLGNPWLEMLFALVFSVPLYICATGSVPLAAILMLKGLSPGAALVILMAGPATNAATITVIGKSMGTRNLILYLLAIISGALVFGWGVNAILPMDYYSTLNISQHASHQHEGGSMWFKYAAAVVLFALMLAGLYRKYFVKDKLMETMETKSNQINIMVKGMTCHHCEANVERSLGGLNGIDHVKANKDSEVVQIEGKGLDLDKISKVIEEIGYTYKGEQKA